jgi:hypothetical protein
MSQRDPERSSECEIAVTHNELLSVVLGFRKGTDPRIRRASKRKIKVVSDQYLIP